MNTIDNIARITLICIAVAMMILTFPLFMLVVVYFVIIAFLGSIWTKLRK